MTHPASVLVVGASAAGLATAEALRRKGYLGTLTLLGDEPHRPYDRPPLSKQVLAGSWDPEKAQLRPTAALSALGADFILGDSAIGLDLRTRTVRTESGRALKADVVVAATGVAARALPGHHDMTGVHVLRTLADASMLRADLMTARRLVVVGAGVLGAEIAATARRMGLDVTVVGTQPAPMARQLGPTISGLLADLHTDNGVSLRPCAAVAGLTADGRGGRVTGVRLASGELIPADVVAVAIGAIPATGWLVGSGLTLDDGVVCDSRCLAADSVYAVGDVARWHHDAQGALVRLENRTNATEQGVAVADNILGADRPYCPVPYFWTDQFDVKIQAHGLLPADADMSIVDGDPAAGRFVAEFRRDGRLTGVIGWNMPKQTGARRRDLVDALREPARALSRV